MHQMLKDLDRPDSNENWYIDEIFFDPYLDELYCRVADKFYIWLVVPSAIYLSYWHPSNTWYGYHPNRSNIDPKWVFKTKSKLWYTYFIMPDKSIYFCDNYKEEGTTIRVFSPYDGKIFTYRKDKFLSLVRKLENDNVTAMPKYLKDIYFV